MVVAKPEVTKFFQVFNIKRVYLCKNANYAAKLKQPVTIFLFSNPMRQTGYGSNQKFKIKDGGFRTVIVFIPVVKLVQCNCNGNAEYSGPSKLIRLAATLHDQTRRTGCTQSQMASCKSEMCICHLPDEIQTTIPMDKPMLSGSSNQTELIARMWCQTGICKSKKATYNLKY